MRRKRTKKEKIVVKIQQAILHIFDFETNMHLFSQTPLDVRNEDVQTFILKQLEVLSYDLQHKQADLQPESPCLPLLQQYRQDHDFVGLATQFAQNMVSELSHCEQVGDQDFLVVEYLEGTKTQLALILLARKSAYTHFVGQSEAGIATEIIRHQAILPNSSQKPTTYAIINLEQQTLVYRDRKRVYDGDKRFILPELILGCSATAQTPKESLKIVNQVAAQIAQDHDVQPSIALAKVKEYLVEAAQNETPIEPLAIAAEVFATEPQLQQSFKVQLQEKAVPQTIPMAAKVAERTGKTHVIKTDTGIEIRIPSESVSNTDYIEFINQPDGTISIQLRNISKIEDR